MPSLRSADDLAELVRQYGFLPFFVDRIGGFSVEENTPSDRWFVDGIDGPWEWKGPAIQMADCAYGKFFCGKAGFITREWFCDFANYRRDGYDFDARYDDGLARAQDKTVYDALEQANRPLLSKEWRKAAGIVKRSAFDAAVTRLQMQGYVITIGFEYATDKHGTPYGWGIARYATPEMHWGSSFTDHVYDKTPERSGALIEEYLTRLLPHAGHEQIMKVLGNRR